MKSICCKAEVKTKYELLGKEYDEGDTNYYICKDCQRACDVE